MKNGPKFHAVCDGWPICGRREITACVNCADCQLCNKRIVAMVELLAAAAAGLDITKDAKTLLAKMNYEPSESVKARAAETDLPPNRPKTGELT